MKTLEEFMQLAPDLIEDDIRIIREEASRSIKYYAHVLLETLSIVSITTQQFISPDYKVIEIDEEIALKFLSGEENVDEWVVGAINGVYEIRKAEKNRFSLDKVSVCPIVEVPFSLEKAPKSTKDVNKNNIAVVIQGEYAKIYYDGEIIKSTGIPLRLYFTKEGNPTYLYCAVRLSCESLDKMAEDNELTGWPNPITIMLGAGVNDLAILALNNGSRVIAYRDDNE